MGKGTRGDRLSTSIEELYEYHQILKDLCEEVSRAAKYEYIRLSDLDGNTSRLREALHRYDDFVSERECKCH